MLDFLGKNMIGFNGSRDTVSGGVLEMLGMKGGLMTTGETNAA